MKVRATAAAPTAELIPLPVARRRLAEAAIVPIARDVSAIMFDAPADGGRARQRLTALFAGQPLREPSISTSLELRSGSRRHLLVVGRSAESLTGTAMTLALGAQLAAILDGDWLQPPIADGATLVRGLSESGRRRLLKLFLTTGASLFGRGSAEFAQAARRLAETVSASALAPVSWCPLGAGGRLVSYRLPAETEEGTIEELIAIGAERVARIENWKALVEAAGARRILHLYLPGATDTGGGLVGLGAAQLHLRAPDAEVPPQALAPWLARRRSEVVAWVAGLVAARAEADPLAAALARELRQTAEAAPRAVVRHLSATPGGVLYAVDLVDGEGLVRALRVERGGATTEVAPAARIAGFAALPGAGEACRLSLVLWSRRVVAAQVGVPDAFCGEAPEALASEPIAVARARLDLRPAAATAVASFGAAREPALSLVAPVSPNLDLIRARAAAVFVESKGRAVEVVYHVRDGALAEASRGAIAQAEAVYGIAHRLVTLPAAASEADGLREALAVAAAPRLLVLGADVLPAGPGWLAAWLGRPDAAPPAMGGVLLDIGGTVLHLGVQSCVGWPARDLPRGSARGAVSAACVGLTRAAAERLAAAPYYPEPDVMLAAALGQDARLLPQCRFVRYGGGAGRSRLAEAVDQAALELVLKPLFRPDADEGRP